MYIRIQLLSQHVHEVAIYFAIDMQLYVVIIMQDGLTPLHKATWNGHKDAIKLLVDSGAAVDAKSNVYLCTTTYMYAYMLFDLFAL